MLVQLEQIEDLVIQLGNYLPLAGGTMVGDIEMGTTNVKSTSTLNFQTGDDNVDFQGLTETLRFDLSLLDGSANISPVVATWQNKAGTVAYLGDIPAPTGYVT